MRRKFLLISGCVLLLAFGLQGTLIEDSRAAPPDSGDHGIDSLLIVKNNIREVRAYSETEVRRSRKDYYDILDRVPMDTAYLITRTQYDDSGRIVSVVDSAWASNEPAVHVTVQAYTYSGNRPATYSRKEVILPGNKKDTSRVVSMETIEWSNSFTRRHTEKEESGQWNVQIDSTVYNNDGQKRQTYTYNSMGDSFVEEYTYDAKARLKYRRLAMKQFWSPPWEMESTSYTYADDGSHTELDSVWRIDPDMNKARARAGKSSQSDYKWRVLMMAPATGAFNRLESREERRYDAQNHLLLRQEWVQYAQMWEDYSWVYDQRGRLVLHTEWRGDRPEDKDGTYGRACTDSIWYEYRLSVLYHEKTRRYCNGYYTAYDDTFQLNPDRVERDDYYGSIKGGVTNVTTFRHGKGVDHYVADARGLPIERRYHDYSNELTIVEYTYYTR